MGEESEPVAERFLDHLGRNPVIPAVYGEGDALDDAIAGDHPAVFVLGGDIFKLVRRLAGVRDRPPVCVNVDLVSGIAGDASGVEYVSEHFDGLISTNSYVIQRANALGLLTVQRLFAIDAGSVKRGMGLIRRARPRCVEVLPARSLQHMVAGHEELLSRPVLAGGLVRTAEEVSAILAAGAAGVSTSARSLW